MAMAPMAAMAQRPWPWPKDHGRGQPLPPTTHLLPNPPLLLAHPLSVMADAFSPSRLLFLAPPPPTFSFRRRSCVFPPRRLLSSAAPHTALWDAQQAQRSDLYTCWIAKVVASLLLHVQPRQRYPGFVVDRLTPSVGYHVVKRLAGCPRICFDFFKFSVFDVGVKHVVPTYSCLVKVLCGGRLVESAREVVDVMWSMDIVWIVRVLGCWLLALLSWGGSRKLLSW